VTEEDPNIPEKDTEEKQAELEKKNKRLQEEVWRLKRKPEGRIGYLLLAIGFLLVGLAIYYSHNVSAFLGMALTFWGALLLYVRPTQFIKKEILDHSVTEPAQNITRLLTELEYEGDPIYISPGTLWGMNNTVLWIPKNRETPAPTDEQLSNQQTIISEPDGLVFIPPGMSLSRLIEETLNTNFSTTDLDYLAFNLERALVEGLEMAESFTMETDNPMIRVEIKGSIFNDLIRESISDERNHKIGDTLNSAIASILARTTRKPVTIESIEINKETVKTTFKLY
jgi:hypothetical protein